MAAHPIHQDYETVQDLVPEGAEDDGAVLDGERDLGDVIPNLSLPDVLHLRPRGRNSVTPSSIGAESPPTVLEGQCWRGVGTSVTHTTNP